MGNLNTNGIGWTCQITINEQKKHMQKCHTHQIYPVIRDDLSPINLMRLHHHITQHTLTVCYHLFCDKSIGLFTHRYQQVFIDIIHAHKCHIITSDMAICHHTHANTVIDAKRCGQLFGNRYRLCLCAAFITFF